MVWYGFILNIKEKASNEKKIYVSIYLSFDGNEYVIWRMEIMGNASS